jgi:hypothetical protein
MEKRITKTPHAKHQRKNSQHSDPDAVQSIEFPINSTDYRHLTGQIDR